MRTKGKVIAARGAGCHLIDVSKRLVNQCLVEIIRSFSNI